MVAAIRAVEKALGSPLKMPSEQEAPNRAVARRSIVAGRKIEAGEMLRADMLAVKRPGTGISGMDLWDLVGRRASRAYETDELLQP